MDAANFLNRKGLTKHQPALPLFDAVDAERTLKQFTVRPYGEWTEIPERMRFRFLNAGHLLESTYGDRKHPADSLSDQLERVVKNTMTRRGVLLIPAFAVGWAQQIIYLLNELMEQKRLPLLPIHLDSPMAVQATRIYSHHPDEQESKGELTAKNVITHRRPGR